MARLILLLLSLCITSVLCASPFDTLSTSPIASSLVIDDQNIISYHQHASTHEETTLATTRPTTATTRPPTAAPTSSSGPVMDSEERAFVKLINDYRAANGGLVPLQLSITITNAAEWMAKDMADKNYFSHTDSLNRDPFVRMAAFKYPQQGYRGENIAAGNALASATFTQWKNSPGHNANM